MLDSNGACQAMPPGPLDYVRESWVKYGEKFLQIIHGNPKYTISPQPVYSSKEEIEAHWADGVAQSSVENEKKRMKSAESDSPKTKKSKHGPPPMQSVDVVINGIEKGVSGIPIPVCSCTGIPRKCDPRGSGGWQSVCCTTSFSLYPLPMSTKRPGVRTAGRRMTQGTFKKVLEKLAADGYDFSEPIDLKTHWIKHSNRSSTVR